MKEIKTAKEKDYKPTDLGKANIYDMFRTAFACITCMVIVITIGICFIVINTPTTYDFTFNLNSDNNSKDMIESIERINILATLDSTGTIETIQRTKGGITTTTITKRAELK